MKTRTKVVVIGGGIAGCSTLYHLTQEGWTDVVLVERDELTSGTTWPHRGNTISNRPLKAFGLLHRNTTLTYFFCVL